MANIEIGGRLHSTATGNVVTGANEVLDDVQNKKQQEINAELIQAVGTGGSVDSKIAAAKEEIIGDAATDYNTLGKLEDKIQAEATRAEAVEEALDGRVDTLEEAVGTGGSVDSRISAAVATETTRAQAAEADRYTKAETYNKNELNNMITTPNQEYVSVIATAQTTAVTDVLPATGAADTTYRIGNWDGTQYNDSVFSEYAWNGSAYIKLSTKSQVGEIYDISVNHADTKYADLKAALGTNGANIPQSLRKGGMSVKFIQSSDNKYVQYRLMSDSFNTTPSNWQGVDDEPTAGSRNLVESGGIKTYINETNQTTEQDVCSIVDFTQYVGWLDSSLTIIGYNQYANARYVVIKVKGGDVITKSNISNGYFVILKEFTYNPNLPYTLVLATGETGRRNQVTNLQLPNDAAYILLAVKFTDDSSLVPSVLTLNGIDLTKSINERIDNEPLRNSNQAVKSKGIYKEIQERSVYGFASGLKNMISVFGHLDSQNNGSIRDYYQSTHLVLNVKSGDVITLKSNTNPQSAFAFVKNYDFNAPLPYNLVLATGSVFTLIPSTGVTVVVPDDAKYIVLTATYTSGENRLPETFIINGYDFTKELWENYKTVDSVIDKNYSGIIERDVQKIPYLNNATKTVNGVEVTCHSDGTFDFEGTGNSNGGKYVQLSGSFTLNPGTYRIKASKNSPSNLIFWIYNSNFSFQFSSALEQQFEVTELTSGTFTLGVNVSNAVQYDVSGQKIEILQRISETKNVTAQDDVAREGIANIRETLGISDYVYSENIGSWWDSVLSQKISQINSIGETMGANGVGFVFITDYHENTSNNVSPAIIKEIQNKTSVKDVVYGGDTHDYYGTSALAVAGLRNQYNNIFKPLQNVIPVRGNHDINPYATDDRDIISDGAWYDIMLRPIEGRATLHGKPYYYLDNNVQKIRYIILDLGSIGHNPWDDNGVQANWLKARLTELDSTWGVIIFNHGCCTQDTQDGAPYIDTRSKFMTDAIDDVYDNLNCTLIAVIGGHQHKDISMVTSKGYRLIITTCDSSGANAASDWNDPDREAGTTNECAFDVVQIDTGNRKIYLTRIGSGSDREFTY